MCLNLNDYQLKARRYSYGSTYQNSIVMKKYIQYRHTQKKKGTQADYKRKSNHKKKKKKELKTSGKQGLKGDKYIPINNQFKWQWTKYSDQKTNRQIGFRGKKTYNF